MQIDTIKTPNLTRKIANIIAEIRTIACIDDVDAEAIEKILQDELTEECRMLDGYYWEEYYKELSSAEHRAYDEGYIVGYNVGHKEGHNVGHYDGYSESNS